MFKSVKVGSRGQADTLVVGLFEGASVPVGVRKLDRTGAVAAAMKRRDFSAGAGSATIAFPDDGEHERVVILGMGEKDACDADRFRRAGASAAKQLAAGKSERATIELASCARGVKGLTEQDAAQAFGEGLGLMGWSFDDLRGSATTSKKGNAKKALQVRSPDAKTTAGLKAGLALAEASNEARRLSQLPASIANTTRMASEARALARKTGMTCRVIQGKALEQERLMGIATVGRAAPAGPCLIRLEYKPARVARGAKPIVLVGKTIVYDTGGLSLKVGGSMPGMKRDKDGGCAVFGAMHAIATIIKPKVPVVALFCCAENSVSREAYRPDDVIEFRNGVTVEVTNTDAEGRLVLADGLIWACEKEKAGAIIDVATLTGGVVVALGDAFAGMWCDDDGLRGAIEKAADATGERVWRLPHDQMYRDMMKSSVADIVNSAPVRKAHPIQGAAFLSYFVEEGVPWAHVDIAGVHANDSDGPVCGKGPTGFGARLLAEAVAQLAE